LTDPGAHQPTVQCVWGLFPGVKRLWRGVDHRRPYSADVKEREVYLYSPQLQSGS